MEQYIVQQTIHNPEFMRKMFSDCFQNMQWFFLDWLDHMHIYEYVFTAYWNRRHYPIVHKIVLDWAGEEKFPDTMTGQQIKDYCGWIMPFIECQEMNKTMSYDDLSIPFQKLLQTVLEICTDRYNTGTRYCSEVFDKLVEQGVIIEIDKDELIPEYPF